MSYEVHIVDRWDIQRKDVYIYSRDPSGTWVLQDGQMVQYGPGQSFEGNPTFTIDYMWEDGLIKALLGGREPDKLLQDELASRLDIESARVEKMLDKLLE